MIYFIEVTTPALEWVTWYFDFETLTWSEVS